MLPTMRVQFRGLRLGDCLRDMEIGPIIVSAILISAATVGGGGFFASFTDNVSFTCRNVEGEVVGKDHDEGWFKIHVTLYNDSAYADGHTNYSVYVGPETYERYAVGEVYTEKMCDVEAHSEFRQLVQELIDAGILEQGS